MFESTEEVINYLEAKFVSNQNALGLGYVGLGENLLAQYPALVLVPGPLIREFAFTHKFDVTFNVIIFLFHARLTASRRVRIKEDLSMAHSVTSLLHADMDLGGNIISSGYVDSESPAIVARPKGDAVVGTRLTWTGKGRPAF